MEKKLTDVTIALAYVDKFDRLWEAKKRDLAKMVLIRPYRYTSKSVMAARGLLRVKA